MARRETAGTRASGQGRTARAAASPGGERRVLRDGAGDALAKAFEMIATPGIFGLGGWFVDSRLGVFPLVTTTAVIVVFGYQVWRFYGDYSAAMDEELQRRRACYAPPAAATGGPDGEGGGPDDRPRLGVGAGHA